MDAPEIHLPAFLEPIFDYLSSALPPPLYSALLTIFTHLWALITSLFTLVTLLISSTPSTWDAQTILPPLITLLMAYLALISFYRTTGWILRTGFWFAKWGSIFALLTAGAGYFMGNAHANGGQNGLFDGRGLIPTIGGFVLDLINGQGQNAAGGNRQRRPYSHSNSQSTYSTSSRARKSKPQERPKAWESWDRHHEWQYQENPGPDGADVQNVIGDILGAAGSVIRESGWWEAAKEFVDGLGKERDDGAQAGSTKRQSDGKAKSNTKAKTGSR